MSTYTRLGARGSRYAKSKARDERNADSLYDRGVLSRPGSFAPKPPSTELIIDDEFHGLIPPQTPEENAALEESLLRDGCNDALVVWQGHNILIDGHHRYELCTKHGIAYTMRELAFDSREDVIVWMVQHQLGRRNISTFVRSELALRMKSAVEAKAKANQLDGLKRGGEPAVRQNSDEREISLRTDESVADMANVSRDTIRKVENVTKHAPEPIKAKARSGEISVNRADLITKALKGASEQITAFVTTRELDDPERVEILKRLEKSQGSPETNGTFDEIMATGGFHYGEDMKLWCDFVTDPIQKIQRGLDSVSEHHKVMAAQDKKARLEQAADITPVALTVEPRVYAENEIVEVGNHVLICADNRSSFVRNYLLQFDAALAFCDPPYNTGKMDWDSGDFCWEQDYLIERARIVAVTPGIGNIPGFMRQTAMPYRWSTSAFISNGMTRGALGFGNWIYTALFSDAKSIHRNAQDVTTISISSKDADDLGAKRQKPPAYLAWLFELLSKPGDVIIDAFGGSGTSAIVAGRLNRRCICIERDIATFTAMVQRIEAEHANTL